MADLVNEVRSMLSGSMGDELTTLSEPYIAGSGLLNFQYPKRAMTAGATLSLGLNTFYVLETASGGLQAVVLPSYDGGPDEDAVLGSVVRVKPRYTNWAIFRELSQEFATLSSPTSGLYSAQWFDAPVDWAYGTYEFPEEYGDPLRLVRARAKISGTTMWHPINSAEYQPEQRVVRTTDIPDGAVTVEFTFAMRFGTPVSLTDDLEDLGLPPEASDLPTLGACAALSLAGESRRNQPFAQGDSRRAEEVPPGASTSVSREFARAYKQRVDEEAARLVATFGGYYSQVPSMHDGRAWGGGMYQ
jgi:hypothetical protein